MTFPVALVLAAFLVLACASAPSTTDAARPLVAEGHDAKFVLQIAATKERYSVGESIQVATRLTYVGPAPSIELGHSGGGPVVVCLEQLDGPFDPGCGSDSSCQHSTMHVGAVLEAGYQKSGGYSGDDPLAAQYRAFFADQLVRLPPGTFRFRAIAEMDEGECGGTHHAPQASITIIVAPGATS